MVPHVYYIRACSGILRQHEMLILPHANLIESGQIKEIIWDINRAEVAAEEVLSDNLYIYEQSTDLLRMV